eukprot:gene5827-9033_t
MLARTSADVQEERNAIYTPASIPNPSNGYSSPIVESTPVSDAENESESPSHIDAKRTELSPKKDLLQTVKSPFRDFQPVEIEWNPSTKIPKVQPNFLPIEPTSHDFEFRANLKASSSVPWKLPSAHTDLEQNMYDSHPLPNHPDNHEFREHIPQWVFSTPWNESLKLKENVPEIQGEPMPIHPDNYKFRDDVHVDVDWKPCAHTPTQQPLLDTTPN